MDQGVAAILGATVALLGALVVALISRRHDRQQQARTVLLEPADAYASAALAVMAKLRRVAPPTFPHSSLVPHRNAHLLDQTDRRDQLLVECRELLDVVRVTRARVRLAFHPRSSAAEQARAVLAGLRASLEAAEEFYSAYDAGRAAGGELPEVEWDGLRDRYKAPRAATYQHLDDFFDEVAQRLVSPSWDPRKVAS